MIQSSMLASNPPFTECLALAKHSLFRLIDKFECLLQQKFRKGGFCRIYKQTLCQWPRQSLPRSPSLHFSGLYPPRSLYSFGFPNPFAANRSRDLSKKRDILFVITVNTELKLFQRFENISKQLWSEA